MKKINRINEYETAQGQMKKVEIIFADGSSVRYTGDMIRTGNMEDEVIRINEFETYDGVMTSMQFTFASGKMLTYKATSIARIGNL